MAGTRTSGKLVARSQSGWFVASLFALCLFVLSFVIAASPALHHWLHEDSHSPRHHCLAAWLPEGKAHASVSFVAPPAPALGMAIVNLPSFKFLPFSQPVYYPGRGPPQH